MLGWGVKQVSGNYLESDPYKNLEVKNGMGAVVSSSKCSGCGFIQYCTKTKLEEGEQILVPSWNLSSHYEVCFKGVRRARRDRQ